MISPIESTYCHTINVYRVVDTVDQWGETRQTREKVLSDIKCAVSYTNPNDRNKAPMIFAGAEGNRMEFHFKLYLNPKYTILAGDEIEHIQTGQKYLAGMPMKYPSHQELAILYRWEEM